jgi:hypothetical protein
LVQVASHVALRAFFTRVTFDRQSMEVFGSKSGSRKLWHKLENCDAEFGLQNHHSASSSDGIEICLSSRK